MLGIGVTFDTIIMPSLYHQHFQSNVFFTLYNGRAVVSIVLMFLVNVSGDCSSLTNKYCVKLIVTKTWKYLPFTSN